MSIELSPEALYVAEHWQTVAEIIEAAQRLRGGMAEFLQSLAGELKVRQWWPNGWVFLSWESGQVYISRESWLSGNYHLVWIGVRGFTPDGVFGLGDAPELFVWVYAKRRSELVTGLAATLNEANLLGEFDRSSSGCVLRHPLPKCLPAMVEAYFPQAREQIIAFLEHYARMADAWDPIVRPYLDAGGAN